MTARNKSHCGAFVKGCSCGGERGGVRVLLLLLLLLLTPSVVWHTAAATAAGTHSRRHIVDVTLLHEPKQQQQARHLQYASLSSSSSNNNSNQWWLSLSFSIWIPMANADLNVTVYQDDDTNPIRVSILQALERLLCSQTDMILTDPTITTTTSSTTTTVAGSNVSNVCTRQQQQQSSRYRHRSRRRKRRSLISSSSSSTVTPSVLDRTPTAVQIVRRAESGWNYAVWNVSYAIVSIGDVYVEEALQNEPNIAIDAVEAAAVHAMQQVVQLAVDVNAMDGSLDQWIQQQQLLLQLNQRVTAVYSSPVQQEAVRFALAAADDARNTVPISPTWYPLRTAGGVVLVLSIALWTTLGTLARYRRRRIIAGAVTTTAAAKTTTRHRPHHHPNSAASIGAESVVLVSPAGVDLMLNRSADFAVHRSSHSITSTSSCSSTTKKKKRSPQPLSPGNFGKVALAVLAEEECWDYNPESHQSLERSHSGGLHDDDDEETVQDLLQQRP